MKSVCFSVYLQIPAVSPMLNIRMPIQKSSDEKLCLGLFSANVVMKMASLVACVLLAKVVSNCSKNIWSIQCISIGVW